MMKKRSLAWVLALVLCISASSVSLATSGTFNPNDKDQAMVWAVDSLMTSVFDAQYDGSSSGYMVRWGGPLRVFLGGEYTQEDFAVVERFIQSLSDRVIWLPDISMVSAPDLANVTIIFAKLDELAGFNLPGYGEGDWGAFSYWFEDNLINRAELLIASDVTTQEDRSYLLQMKLTNALGLTKRIPNFQDSIIVEGYVPKQNLSQIDWLMLNILYEPWLTPGITAQETYDLLLE